jgi:hypothetical protein
MALGMVFVSYRGTACWVTAMSIAMIACMLNGAGS